MGVKYRQSIERKIVLRVVADALRAGYTLEVDNGDNDGERSRDKGALASTLFATDSACLYLYRTPRAKVPFAWVGFVYGNDGWDVISDYSVNIDDLLMPVHAMIERLED